MIPLFADIYKANRRGVLIADQFCCEDLICHSSEFVQGVSRTSQGPVQGRRVRISCTGATSSYFMI